MSASPQDAWLDPAAARKMRRSGALAEDFTMPAQAVAEVQRRSRFGDHMRY